MLLVQRTGLEIGGSLLNRESRAILWPFSSDVVKLLVHSFDARSPDLVARASSLRYQALNELESFHVQMVRRGVTWVHVDAAAFDQLGLIEQPLQELGGEVDYRKRVEIDFVDGGLGQLSAWIRVPLRTLPTDVAR